MKPTKTDQKKIIEDFLAERLKGTVAALLKFKGYNIYEDRRGDDSVSLKFEYVDRLGKFPEIYVNAYLSDFNGDQIMEKIYEKIEAIRKKEDEHFNKGLRELEDEI